MGRAVQDTSSAQARHFHGIDRRRAKACRRDQQGCDGKADGRDKQNNGAELLANRKFFCSGLRIHLSVPSLYNVALITTKLDCLFTSVRNGAMSPLEQKAAVAETNAPDRMGEYNPKGCSLQVAKAMDPLSLK